MAKSQAKQTIAVATGSDGSDVKEAHALMAKARLDGHRAFPVNVAMLDGAPKHDKVLLTKAAKKAAAEHGIKVPKRKPKTVKADEADAGDNGDGDGAAEE